MAMNVLRVSRINHKWASLAAAGIAAVLVAVTPAAAQQGGGGGRNGQRFGGGGPGGGMERAFEPSVTTKQLDAFAKALGFDADQNEVAKLLLEGYQAQFRAKADEVRNKMNELREQMRESRDPSAWSQMGEMFEEFNQAREGLDASFMSDLKAALTPEQQQQWPKVERIQRRMTTMPRGLMSGEQVDVIAIVDKLDLPEDAHKTIDPVLESYSIDLDRALVKRNELFDQFRTNAREMFRPGGDMSAAQEMINKGRDASMALRDINQRYARQVAALLPADQQAAFETEVKKASFPRIYGRPSRAAGQFDAALALPSLSDTQRQSIESLRTTFNRDLDNMNSKLEKGLIESEESFSVERMMQGRWEEGVADLWRERRDMEQNAVQRLRDILTAEQREQLPQANDNEDEGPGARLRGQNRRNGRGGGNNRRPPDDV